MWNSGVFGGLIGNFITENSGVTPGIPTGRQFESDHPYSFTGTWTIWSKWELITPSLLVRNQPSGLPPLV